MPRIAVVLFNLGGPDRPEAVRPFLFNLFSDPAILSVPQPMRWLLARLISGRRAPVAQEIYKHLGGGSPLLPNTQAQASALEDALADVGEVRCFPCMRYWHPMSDAVAREVAAFRPDQTVLLPLYPQFSSTTTGSSFRVWREAAAQHGLTHHGSLVCCYPTEPGFISAVAQLTAAGMEQACAAAPDRAVRVLFSAHGLPERVVAGGDPYQEHVKLSAMLVARELGLVHETPDEGGGRATWSVSYQSRVGPLKWIGPATDAEIRRAGADGAGLVVVPIAFVSEHSETLVELDVEYGHLAKEHRVPAYVRVPTVSTHPRFIEGLADIVRRMVENPRPVRSRLGPRLCWEDRTRCPLSGQSFLPVPPVSQLRTEY